MALPTKSTIDPTGVFAKTIAETAWDWLADGATANTGNTGLDTLTGTWTVKKFSGSDQRPPGHDGGTYITASNGTMRIQSPSAGSDAPGGRIAAGKTHVGDGFWVRFRVSDAKALSLANGTWLTRHDIGTGLIAWEFGQLINSGTSIETAEWKIHQGLNIMPRSNTGGTAVIDGALFSDVPHMALNTWYFVSKSINVVDTNGNVSFGVDGHCVGVVQAVNALTALGDGSSAAHKINTDWTHQFLAGAGVVYDVAPGCVVYQGATCGIGSKLNKFKDLPSAMPAELALDRVFSADFMAASGIVIDAQGTRHVGTATCTATQIGTSGVQPYEKLLVYTGNGLLSTTTLDPDDPDGWGTVTYDSATNTYHVIFRYLYVPDTGSLQFNLPVTLAGGEQRTLRFKLFDGKLRYLRPSPRGAGLFDEQIITGFSSTAIYHLHLIFNQKSGKLNVAMYNMGSGYESARIADSWNVETGVKVASVGVVTANVVVGTSSVHFGTTYAGQRPSIFFGDSYIGAFCAGANTGVTVPGQSGTIDNVRVPLLCGVNNIGPYFSVGQSPTYPRRSARPSRSKLCAWGREIEAPIILARSGNKLSNFIITTLQGLKFVTGCHGVIIGWDVNDMSGINSSNRSTTADTLVANKTTFMTAWCGWGNYLTIMSSPIGSSSAFGAANVDGQVCLQKVEELVEQACAASKDPTLIRFVSLYSNSAECFTGTPDNLHPFGEGARFISAMANGPAASGNELAGTMYDSSGAAIPVHA